MKKVLIIEDDMNILQLERDYLEANKFETVTASNGEKGLELALNHDFNLVLLDIMLPKLDGLQVCREIRKVKNIPIILVSAKKEDLDKIRGLGLGADDYIVKPFSPSELVARVIAHIGRYERLTAPAKAGSRDEDSLIEIGELKIDKKSRRVFVNSREVVFTNKEFDLLAFLAEHPEEVYNKEDLFGEIWKYDSFGETSTVTVHVNRIRDKIKEVSPQSEVIHTIWGRGYRFQ